MRIDSFDWDIVNVGHIARHRVSPDEVEEACFNNPVVLRGRGGRYYILGQADSGRYLMAVLERNSGIARVITARNMTDSERRRFIRR